jgi:hypothetical protein
MTVLQRQMAMLVYVAAIRTSGTRYRAMIRNSW